MKTIVFSFVWMCLVLYEIYTHVYACEKPNPSTDPTRELFTSFNSVSPHDASMANSFRDITEQSINQTRSEDSYSFYGALFETKLSSLNGLGDLWVKFRMLGPITVNTLVLWLIFR